MKNLINAEIDTTSRPDDKGFFGEYGGSFVPEELQKVMDEVAAKYEEISQDPTFVQELASLHEHYTGRPSPVTFAANLTKAVGGARIYLKREDLNHRRPEPDSTESPWPPPRP